MSKPKEWSRYYFGAPCYEQFSHAARWLHALLQGEMKVGIRMGFWGSFTGFLKGFCKGYHKRLGFIIEPY